LARKVMIEQLGIYDNIHRNPVNRLMHAVGIPVIMFSVLSAAALIHFPLGGILGYFLNLGMVLVVFGAVIIGRYDPVSGIALGVFSTVLTVCGVGVANAIGNLAALALFVGLFIAGWIIQFAGHAIERAGPAFGSRPLNLLLGPVSVLNDVLPLVRPAPWRKPN